MERSNSWVSRRVLNRRYPESTVLETYRLHEFSSFLQISGQLPDNGIVEMKRVIKNQALVKVFTFTERLCVLINHNGKQLTLFTSALNLNIEVFIPDMKQKNEKQKFIDLRNSFHKCLSGHQKMILHSQRLK